MHASSILNYHHHHNYQHYYAHQVAAEEGNDASGLRFGPGRSLVTPHQAIESDDNEENGPESVHLASTSTPAEVTGQENPSSAPGLTHQATPASDKVHFVATYESHENSHEHYRYNNDTTTTNNVICNDNTALPYQLANGAHYYEQQLLNSAGCRQAVDLSSEQQQHGPFESPSAIYYDLSAAEHISSNQATTCMAPLDYQHQDNHHHHHHHHHHQHLDMSLQQRQELLVESQREGNPFATYSPYEPANELRYSGEFVSVLTEQNRASRPLGWQDSQPSNVADQAVSSDGCQQLQQYSYEFAPILRPPDGVQLDRNIPNVAYTNAFSMAHTDGSSYPQQMDTIANTNFHPANNENHHQPLELHPNDCNQFHDKQQQQAQTQFNRQRLGYDTHLLDSSLAGHHSNQPQAHREAHRDSAPSRALSSASESMSTNSDMESIDSALTRDEKKAREANIPLSYHEIVNLSIEQFNEQLSRFPYSETQLTLMKDIRRRGKNKVAAQTCRKRKMEQITELQQEVAELANKRILLALERSRLMQEHAKLSEEYESWRTC